MFGRVDKGFTFSASAKSSSSGADVRALVLRQSELRNFWLFVSRNFSILMFERVDKVILLPSKVLTSLAIVSPSSEQNKELCVIRGLHSEQ